MYYALKRAEGRRPGQGRELVHTDSLYALNMTRGKWMPRRKGRRNAPHIATLRRIWRGIQRRRPGEVELRHVRSHVNVPENELADWLAGNGAGSTTSTSPATAASWMTRWLARHTRGPPRDDHARPPGGRGAGASS